MKSHKVGGSVMDINKYLKFEESLKLVRNEVLEDNDSKDLIDEIYTDLLPQNGVMTNCQAKCNT